MGRVHLEGNETWLLESQQQQAHKDKDTPRCHSCGELRPPRMDAWNKDCPTCQQVYERRLEIQELSNAFMVNPRPTANMAKLKAWVEQLPDDTLLIFMDEMENLAWRYNCPRNSSEFQLVFAAYFEALTGPLGGKR